MKQFIIISFLLGHFLTSTGQMRINNDSLIREICQTIKNEKFESDSQALIIGMGSHLAPFLNGMDEKDQSELIYNCYVRLQRECIEFALLLDRLEPHSSNWHRVYSEPDSKASIDDCQDFFKISKFKYLEQNGDTSVAIITDSTWTDYFLDGTYSKLSLTRNSQCDFTITFIESTNELRKNFSKPGDGYRYKILGKQNGFFDIFTELQDKSQMLTTRFFY